mmetsp:Transcript_53650/g.131119  ORF Transcript_53650/g.131119 Transcript_53650/m.131119 type:complete len:221 (+) Transcript_53650:2553-3215(+)
MVCNVHTSSRGHGLDILGRTKEDTNPNPQECFKSYQGKFLSRTSRDAVLRSREARQGHKLLADRGDRVPSAAALGKAAVISVRLRLCPLVRCERRSLPGSVTDKVREGARDTVESRIQLAYQPFRDRHSNDRQGDVGPQIDIVLLQHCQNVADHCPHVHGSATSRPVHAPHDFLDLRFDECRVHLGGALIELNQLLGDLLRIVCRQRMQQISERGRPVLF